MDIAYPRTRCSATAQDLLEPLYATAPRALAWILLEQPGPWGTDALTGSGIDPEVSAELGRRARAHRFKILLIRRRAGRDTCGLRSCFLVRSAQGGSWMEHLRLDGVTGLLDIDPVALAGSSPPGLGEPVHHLWAVCTHGRRDPCCAEYGLRLVRSLAALGGSFGEDLWESSHLGGHRFAANLALFPHGLFYGSVDPPKAIKIFEGYLSHRLVLEGYRGRCCFDEATQAADYLLRDRMGITGIDDLVLRDLENLGEQRYRVTFDHPGGVKEIQLQVTEGPLRRASCNDDKLSPVKFYGVMGL